MFSVASLHLAISAILEIEKLQAEAGLRRVEFKRSNYVTRAKTLPIQEKLH